MNLVEGDSSTGFTVHCQKSLRVDGAVPLDLRWTFNGELIPLERQKIETVNGSSHVSYTNTLDLNVRGTWLEADAGTYGCSARITGTNETSFPGKFQLVVNGECDRLTLLAILKEIAEFDEFSRVIPVCEMHMSRHQKHEVDGLFE